MSKITIGKKEFDAEERILNQSELLFYEENPRIYSIINSDGNVPSQEGIEDILTTMDHVKQLRVSIEQNGGIIDPLIVLNRKGNYIVLEGNSRLAAYRLLARKDPSKWKDVKCSVLSEDITDDDIFTLLGQYHLIGRKDWSKFEQAAYVFRKKNSSKLDNDILAKSVGLSTGTVEQYLRVYTFMRDNDDLRPDRWSYYDEYLKNRGIKKYRDTNPKIDETFVSQVKTGEIKQAVDVRDLLGTVAKGTDKTAKRLMNEIIEGKTSIYDAHERFEATGKTGGAYTKVKKFRETFTDDDFQKKIKTEAATTKDIAFELKKIKQAVEKLLKDIGE
ncbi:MAG: hypothetical protein HPY66_2140 [Firmicutes bacterium]|nr:hypothetical protein [Bacillota bacterium]MDI6686875.1 ParB N-terminal domain-containing protein [Desulfobacterales bacterium]